MNALSKAFLLVILCLGVVGAGIAAYRYSTKGDSSSEVVASFYPMAYFASRVLGSTTPVTTLIPAGTEPHEYELTSSDRATLERARVLILNGGVEPWGEDVSKLVSNPDVAVVTAGDSLFSLSSAEKEESLDPHVWLDPVLAKQEVQRISNALVNAYPDQSSEIAENTVRLLSELDALDVEYQTGLKVCTTREFVTAHAAFGYLAKRYELTQTALSGLSPEEEPSVQRLAEVATLVKEKNISYIFFEETSTPDFAETLAAETGAQMLELNPLEGLSDADLANGETYFTVMRTNLDNLQIALQCSPQ